ncbi:Protein kinase domain containing protein, partial [Reticulomyxa filosa]
LFFAVVFFLKCATSFENQMKTQMESKDVEMKDLRGRNRFKLAKVLANTLQGRVYLAQDKTGEYPWAVVKETWRELVKQGKSRDGHKVPENFEREKKIQLYLSTQKEQNEGSHKKKGEKREGITTSSTSNEQKRTKKKGYVRCIESWEDENCYYLAMEHCGAGELFDFIRDNHTKGELSKIVKSVSTQEQKCQKTPNPWSLCVQSLFRQLVSTVSWMHAKGVAHLDLSLENTMLASIIGNEAKIKIIDFGLAQHFTPNQKFKEKVGKVGYMAPEGKKKTDQNCYFFFKFDFNVTKNKNKKGVCKARISARESRHLVLRSDVVHDVGWCPPV